MPKASSKQLYMRFPYDNAWRPSAAWEESCREVARFRHQRGHCKIPFRYGRLGRWVTIQRTHQELLSLDQHSRLSELDFIWDSTRSFQETVWKTMFHRLQEFEHDHGHAWVPADYLEDQALAAWVQNQRHRKQRLDAERLQRLNSLGFCWSDSIDDVVVSVTVPATINAATETQLVKAAPASGPALGDDSESDQESKSPESEAVANKEDEATTSSKSTSPPASVTTTTVAT